MEHPCDDVDGAVPYEFISRWESTTLDGSRDFTLDSKEEVSGEDYRLVYLEDGTVLTEYIRV